MTSPAQWFKWKQRYIYQTAGDTYTYMGGYGQGADEYYASTTEAYYGINTWLSETSPETVDTEQYVRVQPYDIEDVDTDFMDPYNENNEGMTWYSVGMPGLEFDDEIIIFDYPLVLGKTWSSMTTLMDFIPVVFNAVVVAYVPADIDDPSDTIVADNYTYELPVDISDIPMPLAELGDLGWRELTDATDAEIDWMDVLIPGTEINITGYYVIKTELEILGITVMKQELWKDVRGYVPLYDIYKYPPLAKSVTHTVKLAKKWTGTPAGLDD